MSDITHEDATQKLAELIKDIRVAMLTTAAEDGALHSRPMATLEREFDGTLWFFTDAESGKVYEVRADQHVNLAYSSPRSNSFVSVAGRALVTRDQAKIKELWSPAMKAWFPEGEDDPNIALLCVQVESAQYWDTPDSKAVHLIGFVKATVQGQRYQPGDNEKVEFSN
jgi:general stress protein 26